MMMGRPKLPPGERYARKLIKNRAWEARNREHRKKYFAAMYQKRKSDPAFIEKRRGWAKAYAARCPDLIRERRRAWNKKNYAVKKIATILGVTIAEARVMK